MAKRKTKERNEKAKKDKKIKSTQQKGIQD